MNVLINTAWLTVAEVVGICNYYRSVRKFKIKALTEKSLAFSAGRGKPHHLSDIDLAHQILDLKNTIFICENFNFGCPDLIARALISTRSVAITNLSLPADALQEHLKFELIEMAGVAGKPQHLVSTLHPLNRGPGTGSFRKGCILMVGEAPGKPESLGYRDAAFFSKEASSKFLSESMAAVKVKQDDFYWINAFDRRGKETKWTFVNLLKPRLVFAFGRVAESQLKKASIPHIYVPHPSYWKRYRSKEEYPLIEELNKVYHENRNSQP